MQERLKLLKQLLGISDDSKDAILEYELSTVEDMILNYCNIKEIPKRLENILIGMCADYHRASGYGDEEGRGAAQERERGRHFGLLRFGVFGI